MTEIIPIAADHAGFALKELLVSELRRLGYEPQDLGTRSAESTDYPPYAHQVAEQVETGQTTSNKEIAKPEDMRGLKIRVPDAPLYKMFPEAVGGNPTPIAFAEVYLALQTGTVDGQENRCRPSRRRNSTRCRSTSR